LSAPATLRRHDARHAQVDLAELIDREARRWRGGCRRSSRGRLGLEERIELLGVHACHEVLVGVDTFGQYGGVAPGEGARQAEQLLRHACA
jgi:hypothetical protein